MLFRSPSFSASDSLLAEAAAAGARAARPRATAPAAALPRPAFGSSPNLQALVLEAEAADARPEAAFYEVTIASVDQPKLLSRLSEALVRGGSFLFAFFSSFFRLHQRRTEGKTHIFPPLSLSFLSLQKTLSPPRATSTSTSARRTPSTPSTASRSTSSSSTAGRGRRPTSSRTS